MAITCKQIINYEYKYLGIWLGGSCIHHFGFAHCWRCCMVAEVWTISLAVAFTAVVLIICFTIDLSFI